MKKISLFLSLVFVIMLLTSNAKAQNNYPLSFRIKVTNTNSLSVSDLAISLPINEIKKKYSNFNCQNFIVEDNGKEIASEITNSELDGKSLIFVANFAGKEKRTFTVKYSPDGTQAHTYKKRTQAELSHKFGGTWNNRKYEGGTFKNVDYLRVPAEHTDHSFFIRYEGPGWESDMVGYRFYLDWRNANDVFGKKTTDMVLQNVGQDGFDSYHEPAAWGQDNFKVGKSLGIGSIALWSENKVNMLAVTDSTNCRIVQNGCLKSLIHTNYFGWNVSNVKRNVQSEISITAGSRLSKCALKIDGTPAQFTTGLIKDKESPLITPTEKANKWTYMATWGKCLALDNQGIAVFVKTSDLEKLSSDDLNHLFIMKPNKTEFTYYFCAAWEQETNGIRNVEAFKKYLEEVRLMLDNEPNVQIK